ncbi:MAG: SAM-dependent chlorinase/fluorinase, partial [Candidatus Rokubacteria bacterium]|nr:SAM-dependent chlorinase/fluorinase [Candidatus Rokubacteria bacterium]
MPPIVTLTTDFGLRDPFVGVMKGVILGICPEAHLVDLTHDIDPQDILGAQLALESSVPFFPVGTVHLAVVDPGVGSARRALAVQSAGQCFVGPDNGLLSFAFKTTGWTAVSLTAEHYRRPHVSQTFHGRDVFAPAAAHLARGVRLEHFGSPVLDPVRLDLPAAREEGGALVGEVIAEDRFGNLITSLMAEGMAR